MTEIKRRLDGKVALITGAAGGIGSAMVRRFVAEGARVGAADLNANGVRELFQGSQPADQLESVQMDVTSEISVRAAVDSIVNRWGRIDVLHYNVGVSIAGGDAPLAEITEAAFDRIMTINLRGAIMACKHVLPVMRAQRSGVIITISSVAAWEQYPNVAYKATKAGMIAFTQQLAIQNAEFGVRANVILPGLMDTPMAVDTRARVSGKSRAEVAASSCRRRDLHLPDASADPAGRPRRLPHLRHGAGAGIARRRRSAEP